MSNCSLISFTTRDYAFLSLKIVLWAYFNRLKSHSLKKKKLTPAGLFTFGMECGDVMRSWGEHPVVLLS